MRSGAPELVGRRYEQEQLVQLLTQVTDHVLVVSGEAGAGKTALIDQLCGRAAADGWRVVRLQGVEAEESFALGGLHQLVYALQEFQSELDQQARAVLAPVFGGDPDSVVAVLPLVSALLSLLAVAAQATPLLLAVDDVHWLDGISVQVLGAVGRRLKHPRVRIVAGRRVPHQSVPLTNGWAELPLTPLTPMESAEMLDRAGVRLTPRARAAILAAASGNPLALAELPQCADAVADWNGAAPLTERLVAVFGGRLDRLGEDVRVELLRAALDGNQDGTPSKLRARYVMRNVESAIAAGVLVTNASGDLAFRHPLVRAAVIHTANPHERRGAHRDLAALYPDVLVRRAIHLAAATVEPDREVAELLVAAAKLTGRRGGLCIVVEWLRRAGELSPDPSRRAELFADAVFVAARAGRLCVDGPGGFEVDGDTVAVAILADAYRDFHRDGEVVATHRALLQALTRADGLDDKAVSRLVHLLMSITNYSGDDERWTRTQSVVLPLESRLNPAILLYRNNIDNIASTAGNIRAVLNKYVDRLWLLHPRQLLLLAFPAYCIDAMAHVRGPLRLAFDQLRDDGTSIDAIEGGRVVMLDLIAGGQWPEAEVVGATCLAMAQQANGSLLRYHQFLADLGLLAAGRGDRKTAEGYAAEVRAWSGPRGLRRLLDAADRIAVKIALSEGDFETAYRAAVRINPSEQFPRQNIHEVVDDMLDLVEAAVQTGRLAEARERMARAERQQIAQISPRAEAVTIAMAAMAGPDSESADRYQSALAHPGLAGFPFEHARICSAQGRWLRLHWRHAESRAALTRAAAGFDRLGARPWADRARSELWEATSSAGLSPGATAPLTAQERRIVELVAVGHTTKQIAEQLCLSPRTVDTHLYRLFRKFGITRRSELGEALQGNRSAVGPVPPDG
jgi:DNA-binding CsgD family transcriptional regulator